MSSKYGNADNKGLIGNCMKIKSSEVNNLLTFSLLAAYTDEKEKKMFLIVIYKEI
jgi:hypothetical protein